MGGGAQALLVLLSVAGKIVRHKTAILHKIELAQTSILTVHGPFLLICRLRVLKCRLVAGEEVQKFGLSRTSKGFNIVDGSGLQP